MFSYDYIIQFPLGNVMHAVLIPPVTDTAARINCFKHHLFLGFANGYHKQNFKVFGYGKDSSEGFTVDRAEHAAAQPFFPGAQKDRLGSAAVIAAGILTDIPVPTDDDTGRRSFAVFRPRPGT